MPLKRLAILVVWLCACVPFELSAQPAPRPNLDEATISMRFESRPITEVVTKVGLATGTRFIFSDKLTGRIHITVPGKVTGNEALELVNAMLYMWGHVAIPMEGGAVKIVPFKDALGSAPALTAGESLDPDGQRSVVTLLRLEHANAVSVADTLGNYVSKTGVAIAYEPSNSVILAGTEAQLRRLHFMAQTLDRASEEGVMAKVLRHRSADTVADWIDGVFNEDTAKANRVKIWTDERTNMIIAQASPKRLDALRLFIDDFDRPEKGQGNLHVIPIRNRDAEQLATIIRSFAQSAPAVGSRPGRPESPEAADIGAELTGRDFGLTVDGPTRSLVVRADAETYGLIRDLVDQLDIIPPRISVEVVIMEITRPSGFSLGFDFFLPVNEPMGANDVVGFVKSTPSGGLSPTGVPSGPTGSSQLFGRYVRDPIQLSLTDGAGNTTVTTVPTQDVSIQAGEQTAETSLLLRPQIVVLSGEEHEVFAGNNVPVPTSATPTEQAAAPGFLPATTITQNIERVDIGVGLRVRPIVGEKGIVILEVDLEISDIAASAAGDVDRVGPTFISQTINATLRLNSARHAVIGTYTGQTIANSRRGTPFLMDIPVLGYLFSRVDKRRIDSSVVAIVSARVLRTPEEDIAESIRQRMAFERSISRTFDVRKLTNAPYAVLLETTRNEFLARKIALGFEEDGYPTRVTEWSMNGAPHWDVYLTGVETFEEAGELANRLIGAEWNPRITVLPGENEFAIE